jgi:hypothetical protein
MTIAIEQIPKTAVYTKVTTILNPFTGYDKVPENILKMAQDKGTAVHKIIETYLQQEDVDFIIDLLDAKKYLKYYESFKKFWDHSWEIILMECRLNNDDYMLTGQSDVIIEIDNKTVLIDWKTSSKPNHTWHAQGSAYSWLAKQNGYGVDEIWFVKLDKNGQMPEIFKFQEDFKKLLNCYECYHNFFKDKQEVNLED